MGHIGDLTGITHHDDVGGALEERRQNVEVVACQPSRPRRERWRGLSEQFGAFR